MIAVKALTPADIDFLQKISSLYSVDFRAIGESLDLEIIDMWKYENLMPWVLKNKYVVTNGLSKLLQYDNENFLLEIPMGGKATISVFERLSTLQLSAEVKDLWTAIPHPAADAFSAERNLRINYTYSDFLKNNDKISQKELLGDQTPKWKKISIEDVDSSFLERDVYFKRQFGSGGYTLHRSAEFNDVNIMKDTIFNDNFSLWFAEETVKGIPASIQVIKSASLGTVIFGYTRQKIIDNKYFAGSDLLNLHSLTPEIIMQLESAIEKLKPLLENYEGFFGIDFMLDQLNVNILEANIRFTAATIPTLLMNERMKHTGEYFEDYSIRDLMDGDLAIGMHPHKDTCDIVRFFS
jgi:hypothetical protein